MENTKGFTPNIEATLAQLNRACAFSASPKTRALLAASVRAIEHLRVKSNTCPRCLWSIDLDDKAQRDKWAKLTANARQHP